MKGGHMLKSKKVLNHCTLVYILPLQLHNIKHSPFKFYLMSQSFLGEKGHELAISNRQSMGMGHRDSSPIKGIIKSTCRMWFSTCGCSGPFTFKQNSLDWPQFLV